MIIETRKRGRVYKESIIIWEYQTNEKRGIIEKTPIYVYERPNTYLIAKQKGKGYFSYRVKSVIKKKETGIILYNELLERSYLYLLSDDDNKAKELFSEHFEKLKGQEKNKLAQAQAKYNRKCAILDCLSLLEIREVE